MKLKTLVTIIVLAGVVALLVWGFLAGRKEAAMERERELPVKAPSRVSAKAGEAVVTLDAATRQRAGIAVTAPEPHTHREQLHAYAIVLDLQELVELRANIEKTQGNLAASRKQYERLLALHEDERNVSDKAVQAAEAVARADDAALRAFEAQARQRWGNALAQWLLEGSPQLDRLLKAEDVLVQVTVPADVSLPAAPEMATLQTSNGKLVSAKFVSAAPRTDRRLQGQSFLYIADGLLSGQNVPALLPVGAEQQGVIVPASAAVWSQGKAWVYLQKAADQFARREIATDQPVEGGWFVSQGLSAADKLVTTGAQLLLSEEFRAQIQVGEESNR